MTINVKLIAQYVTWIKDSIIRCQCDWKIVINMEKIIVGILAYVYVRIVSAFKSVDYTSVT